MLCNKVLRWCFWVKFCSLFCLEKNGTAMAVLAAPLPAALQHCVYHSHTLSLTTSHCVCVAYLQEKFKTGLLAQSEDFKKQVNSLVEDFHSNGPFSSAVTSENAIALINNMRAQLQGLKDQEQQLRRGLGIFKIDQPPSKDITRMEHVSRGCWLSWNTWVVVSCRVICCLNIGCGYSAERLIWSTVEPLLYDHPQNHIGVVV